jgi:hypothetical protein
MGLLFFGPFPFLHLDLDLSINLVGETNDILKILMKLEENLALGKLQIQPPDLDVLAPGPYKIRVSLPGNLLFCL